MAVYQISKIQIRRGQKGTATGIPQLASGELAWAIDAQELYIGNGALAEGAPEVGNTRIFTEHDNIFEFTKYIYEENLNDFVPNAFIQTGQYEETPTYQNVQDVLDRFVYAENFGVKPPLREDTSFDPGDAIVYTLTDGTLINLNTEAIQRAINELFSNQDLVNLNTDDYLNYGKPKHDYRVQLRFTPGVYNLTRTIYLPSFVSIIGAGIDKTIFNFIGTGPVFQTVNDSAFAQYDYNDEATRGMPVETQDTTITTQPAFISLQDFTIKITSDNNDAMTGLSLDSVTNSTFKNIRITGTWTTTNLVSAQIGVHLTADDNFVTSSGNVFSNIQLENLTAGVVSKYDIVENIFDLCKFEDLQWGVRFGVGTDTNVEGQYHGPRKNIISNSIFKDVITHGIQVDTGYGNKSRGNTFINVGNNGSDNTGATYSPLLMCEGNSSTHDTFDRHEALQHSRSYNYVPVVSGSVYLQNNETYKIDVAASNVFVDAFRIPLNDATGYNIKYLYQSDFNNIVRSGTLTVAIDKINSTVQLVDNYEYAGAEEHAEKLEFFSELLADPSNKSLVIKFKNSVTTDVATLTFTYSVLT